MKGTSCSQGQTSDALAKSVSKIQVGQLHNLLHRPSFNYLKTELNSHIGSLITGGQSKRGRNLNVSADRSPNNSQWCCASQERTALQSTQASLLLFPCSALLPHDSDSPKSCQSMSKQLQRFCYPHPAGIRGTCRLVDTWHPHSLRASEDLTHSH